jgi:tRNA 2-thiouridine synthesizing protein A
MTGAPVDATLDATGLICPLPVLRARRALRDLADGAVLEMRATDPASRKDVPAFCAATGHALVSATEAEGIFIYWIRKGG